MSRPTSRTPKNFCDSRPVISADTFLVPARDAGFDFFTGVPCSFLTPIINRVIGDARSNYVAAASEGEAVAIAAGAWLAGRGTVVMCQNSGLGNAINPLTSLNYPFRIPTLLIVTWRGAPGLEDEPQHRADGGHYAGLAGDHPRPPRGLSRGRGGGRRIPGGGAGGNGTHRPALCLHHGEGQRPR